MGALNNLLGTAASRVGLYPATERGALLESLTLARESLRDAALQFRREDEGWAPIGTTAEGEESFTAQQRRDNTRVCRAFAVANPLAKNGLNIRAAFVWGTGVGITATDPKINETVQGFLDDPRNRATFAGHQAHLELEQALATDGNVFLACFTDPRTGGVQVRTLPSTQVVEVVPNPDDVSEPWYYRRRWQAGGDTREALYPAVSYKPAGKPRRIDGVEVRWDAPVYHVKDNQNPGDLFGVPDLFASVAWLRGYTGMLNDWAKITRALSTIVFKISGKTKNDTLEARAAMQAALAHGQAGGAIASTNAEISTVPKTDANIDAESGLPLVRMVAAGLGLPYTLLLGDPGVTGARATAETLTQPMVLGFKNRRELWTECIRSILNHVIDSAVEAPAGALTGTRRIEQGRVVITPTGERTITFDWPEIEEITLEETMDAVGVLDSSGLAPKETLARIALRGLRQRDVDETIDSMRDERGNFIPAGAAVADALITQYHAGGGA